MRKERGINVNVIPDQIEQVISDPASFGVTLCVLCEKVPSYLGTFFPTPTFAKRIGQPKGKHRLVVYAICDDCFELPNRTERVEASFLSSMAVQ